MKQRIEDKFTDIPISKHRRWQLGQEKAGTRISCGKLTVEHQFGDLPAKVMVIRLRENQRKMLSRERRNSRVPTYSFTSNG